MTSTGLQPPAAELRESAAEVFITLGDEPLKWFSSAFGSDPSLGAYGDDPETYGRMHDLEINGRNVKLLPLVLPKAGRRSGPPQFALERASRYLETGISTRVTCSSLSSRPPVCQHTRDIQARGRWVECPQAICTAWTTGWSRSRSSIEVWSSVSNLALLPGFREWRSVAA